MPSEIAPRLARNSLYFAIKSAIALALMLLVMPYAIRVLGKEVYGIWALAGVVTSYAQLSDFGIAESVIKYAAEYRARRDGAAINRLINTVIVTHLLLALVVGWLLWLLLPFVASNILRIPLSLQEEAVLIFRLSVVVFFVNMVTGVFASLIIATQQMGYVTTVNIISACMGALGAIVFLSQGFGLRGLIMTNAGVALIAAILNVWFAYRLTPGLRINPVRWADKGMFKHILGYSWKTQTSNLAQLLIFQFDRILLSRYLGLEAVTYYEVGSNAAMYVRTFVMALFSPILPAASELQANEERQLLVGLYQRAFKFAVLIAVPLLFLVAGLAYPFVSLWMGAGFELSALTLQLLMPIYLVNILTGPGMFLLNGIGSPEVAMRAAVIAGITNLFFCLTLIKTVGYFGLIAGIGISLLIAAFYFFTSLHRSLPELGRGMYWVALLKPLLYCTPVALGLHSLAPTLIRGGFPAFIAVGLACLGGVGYLLLKGNYLDNFEREVLSRMLLRRP